MDFVKIKCHNVDIERGVKSTTEASAKAGTHDDQQAFILVAEKTRKKITKNAKKSDF